MGNKGISNSNAEKTISRRTFVNSMATLAGGGWYGRQDGAGSTKFACRTSKRYQSHDPFRCLTPRHRLPGIKVYLVCQSQRVKVERLFCSLAKAHNS